MGSVKITKKKIQVYEGVRQSGITNMFMITTVMELSGLTRPEVMEIMTHYGKYMKEFKIERN